jgi:muramoyltetrapeptide carboxypeptidase
MIRPPQLQQGDTIGLVAPGRKVSQPDVAASLSVFASWGLQVKLAPNLFSEDHAYLAGTDQQRLEDFQLMMEDPSVSAIICARGGYGSSRFVDHLDFSALRNAPKWIVGFSDVTAIHLKLFSLGIQSIHATMPILFSQAQSKGSVDKLREVLFGESSSIASPGHPKNKTGTVSGQIIGGNLSLIVDSLGTSSEPDTEGKILVVEEIDEYRYRIDRMMNHLKRAGKLKGLAGLVVGHMTDIKDSTLPFGETEEEIVLHHTQGSHYPIAFQFPIGHENPNLAWKHGATVELVVDQRQTSLSF